MIFTKEIHEKLFTGFIIKDCVIVSHEKQVYLLVEDDDEKIRDGYLPDTRFIHTFPVEEKHMKNYFGAGYDFYSRAKLAYVDKSQETIGVDIQGQIYLRRNLDEPSCDEELPVDIKGSEFRTVYTNVKAIGGSIYAIGQPRLLYKRNGVDDWELLSESIPLPIEYVEKSATMGKYGWGDFDGYSEQDMVLVGGKGDVWHFNGEKFQQLDFPSNEKIRNVCCAGDGYIYIGGRRGRLWRGKGDTWTLVSEQEFSIPWGDIVWFEGRLFLGSDYGLWEFKDGEVIRAEVPDQVLTCSGSISICPEKKYLLTAGNNGASMYDGKEWTVLFDEFDLPE